MIKEYQGYLVSEDGTITKGNKKIKAHYTKQGYIRTTLNGKKVLLHHLLALLFIPNPNNYTFVNHKDENKSNNNLDNLEWCTPQYNKEYSQGKAIAQYDLKGNLIAKYKSASSAARATGITQGSISRVARKERNQTNGFVFEYIEQ